jgi:hypothetical protein
MKKLKDLLHRYIIFWRCTGRGMEFIFFAIHGIAEIFVFMLLAL